MDANQFFKSERKPVFHWFLLALLVFTIIDISSCHARAEGEALIVADSDGALDIKGSRPSAVKTVTVTIDGITHRGTYFVQGSMVHVQSTLGSKTTQVGGSPPETIAKLLLSELGREAKGK